MTKPSNKEFLALAKELGVCGIALLLLVAHLLGFLPASGEVTRAASAASTPAAGLPAGCSVLVVAPDGHLACSTP